MMTKILEPKFEYRPYDYSDLLQYRDAIRHSYWLHTEFSLTGDIQDWYVSVTPAERELLRRTMLAISQVEVAVKLFWSRLYDRIPRPEIAEVGMTFAESEVRHANAYAHLLEALKLDDDFRKALVESPVFRRRVQTLMEAQSFAKDGTEKGLITSLILFSSIVEHVSLFSQFLIIMSFNKHRGIFKGISNIVEATSKEEQIHGMFGRHLVNLLKQEYPELFDSDMLFKINQSFINSYQTEMELIDWFFENGEPDFLPKSDVVNYVLYRYNDCLEAFGLTPMFQVDERALERVRWFEEELMTTKENDFFWKRSITYSKKMRSFTEDSLF
jgi:ribonucleoside-diphosphate reductase beta chain